MEQAPLSKYPNVIFRGLAVPGAISIPQTEDLVAIWKTKSGQRFQNYRAICKVNVDGLQRHGLRLTLGFDWIGQLETYELSRSTSRVYDHSAPRITA